MGKTSTPWRPVNQSTTTAPITRVINPAKSGEAGSVRATQQPVGTPATRGVAYNERAQLSEAAKGGDAAAMPFLPGDAASIQRPTSSPVPTVSDYQERDTKADDK